ncbi:MAG: hypothetical protein ABI910_10055 [Gemmatimonadota bacterium]
MSHAPRIHRLRRAVTFASAAAIGACSSVSTDAPASPIVLTQRTPCTGGTSVVIGASQGVRVDCSNGGTTVSVPGNGASYLIVPEFVTENPALDQLVSYRMFADNPAAGSISARRASPSSAAATLSSLGGHRVGSEIVPPSLAQMQADQILRRKGRANYRAAQRATVFNRSPSFDLLADVATPAVGSHRSFRVLSSFSQNTYATVGARLSFAGANVLLYVDTLAPPNGFTAEQLVAFGNNFDQTLYPIATSAFGAPSDLDQNGRVIMLMSPKVNADSPSATCNTIGYVAGFFDTVDFDGPSDPNSNQGEIFYSIVPDPAATVSCAHSVSDLGTSIPATFLHELQHLINFSQHVVVNGLQPGASWLDEGMSIAAEELGSLHYEQQCPPPACRTNAAQLFPDSSQGFANGFLYDSYQYALLPDTASITYGDDSQNGFSWRGGVWLLARWLGDQHGNAIFQKLERGPSDGIADIEQATGESFPSLFTRFGFALYVDSIPGSPRSAAPANMRFVSRNIRQLWARLFVTSSGASDVPRESPLLTYPVSRDSSLSVMLPGTTTYFRLNTPPTAARVTVEFSGPVGAAFSPTLGAQMGIFKLP